MYKYIIFDLDQTLVLHDYSGEDERFANYLGIPISTTFATQFREFLDNISIELYDLKITKSTLGDIIGNYIPYLEHYNVEPSKLIKAMAETCIDKEDAIPDTRKMLERVSKDFTLYVLTDWFIDLQIIQLEKYDMVKYFEKIYTWDNFYPKPNPKSLERIIGKNNPSDYLYIGDSLNSDVKLANSLSVPSVWFNPSQSKNTTDIIPTYEIHNWNMLFDILYQDILTL